ncbi:NAD(P)H-dependent oxidoreductase [Eleftheria terrae]|uniref:NAD(P)H-dependent oxidoreductase n=1 Tax=Eleftheria terrae TaxID=1597781 RepID=UPI0034332058
MIALSVVAHPHPASLSHAMAGAANSVLAEQGYEVAFHDLYAENFQPVQPTGELENVASQDPLVEQHCEELAGADLVLVFHPNWWGQPPAILKGWIDRVFRLNTAYGYPPGVPPEGVPAGLLKARHALVFNTSNTPAQREQEVFGDPLEVLWKRCVFQLCGVESVVRRMYGPVSGSTAQQRQGWIDEVRATVLGAA